MNDYILKQNMEDENDEIIDEKTSVLIQWKTSHIPKLMNSLQEIQIKPTSEISLWSAFLISFTENFILKPKDPKQELEKMSKKINPYSTVQNILEKRDKTNIQDDSNQEEESEEEDENKNDDYLDNLSFQLSDDEEIKMDKENSLKLLIIISIIKKSKSYSKILKTNQKMIKYNFSKEQTKD